MYGVVYAGITDDISARITTGIKLTSRLASLLTSRLASLLASLLTSRLTSLLTSRLASLLTSRLASLLTHNVCVDISVDITVDITVDISAEPTIAWVLCMWRRTNCGMLNEHSIIGNECLYWVAWQAGELPSTWIRYTELDDYLVWLTGMAQLIYVCIYE